MMSKENRFKTVVEDVGDEERFLRRYAPLMILRGIAGLIGGGVLLFWPRAGLVVVALSLGTLLTVDGAERLIALLRFPGESRRSDLLGIIGALLRLIFGLLILLRPVESGGFWVALIFVSAGLNLIIGSLVPLWTRRSGPARPLALGVTLEMLILGLLMIPLFMVTTLVLLRLLGVVMILGAVPSLALGLRSR